MPKKFDWTEEKIAELKALHGTISVQQLADHFGFTLAPMYAQLRKFGLNKKGRKQRNDRSAIGEISYRKDGTQYIMSEKGWMLHSTYLWKQAGREIPPKHKICFIDGDPTNCVLENLELRTMQEIAWMGVRARKQGLNPGCKTASVVWEQEKRRQKRLADKKVRSEEKARKRAENALKREAAKKERERLARIAKEQERLRKKREREAAKTEKQWQASSRYNAKLSEAKRFQMKPVDDTVPKVFVKQIRAWIYLKPGQKPEDILRKYQKTAA